MKFAIVNGTKAEATKGLKGICPSCGAELIAKCGEHKINHWAHKASRNCDPWWEPETDWHRTWKNNYPIEWQEVILSDEITGEKHIADIRTAHSLVIEFQHSPIDPKERDTREKFYQNMVWIIDGTRLKRDYPRFLKGKKGFLDTTNSKLFLVEYPEDTFQPAWLGSPVPVIFDFSGSGTTDNQAEVNKLYCIFPIRKGRYAILAEITRRAFIKTTINGEWSMSVSNFIEKLIYEKQEQQNQIPPKQPQMKVRKKASTHFYDARKGRFVKRRRL